MDRNRLNSLGVIELRENNYNDSSLLTRALTNIKKRNISKNTHSHSHSPSMFGILKSADNANNLFDVAR